MFSVFKAEIGGFSFSLVLALRIIKGVVVRFILVEISETSMGMKKRQRTLYVRTQFCIKMEKRMIVYYSVVV